jgi:hypothetical protein
MWWKVPAHLCAWSHLGWSCTLLGPLTAHARGFCNRCRVLYSLQGKGALEQVCLLSHYQEPSYCLFFIIMYFFSGTRIP